MHPDRLPHPGLFEAYLSRWSQEDVCTDQKHVVKRLRPQTAEGFELDDLLHELAIREQKAFGYVKHGRLLKR